MNKNFGLNSNQMILIKGFLEDLLKNKTQSKVFVFGSRVKGRERKYSDLDLWVETVPELSDTEIADFIEKVNSSDLSIKIDIVTPRTCLDAYKDRISNEKVLWKT
jgi:predicted nucleotidyltransferase